MVIIIYNEQTQNTSGLGNEGSDWLLEVVFSRVFVSESSFLIFRLSDVRLWTIKKPSHTLNVCENETFAFLFSYSSVEVCKFTFRM